jgi:hypothetical protein
MFYFNILQLQLGFTHYISRRYWKVLVLCITVSIRFYSQCFKQVLEMNSLSLQTSITPKKSAFHCTLKFRDETEDNVSCMLFHDFFRSPSIQGLLLYTLFFITFYK